MANLKYFNPSTSQWENIIAGQKGESGIVAQDTEPTDTSVLWLDTDEDGVGIPLGGTTGQALVKVNNSDFNTTWASTPQLTGGNTFTGTQTTNASFTSTSTSLDARFIATNPASGSGDYLYLLQGSNNTGVKATHFVNSSTRTVDGGVNSYTIRNDGGSLILGNSGFGTIVNGVTRTPNQPSFQGTGSGGQINTNNVQLVFDNQGAFGSHNIGNHYNTSNGVYTAPVAGRYLINFFMLTNPPNMGNSSVQIMLRINGLDRYFVAHSHLGSWVVEGMSMVFNLSANDNITFFQYRGSGHYGAYSSLSISLVG